MTSLAPSMKVDEPPPRGPFLRYDRLFNIVFVIFICTGIIAALKPSPYDFLSLLVVPMWFVGGFKIHRTVVFVVMLWCIFEVCGFISLMPYWDEVDARIYQFQSLYLFFTVVFFTLFFSEHTNARAELCLKAYTASSIFCAMIGIASYFDIGGIGWLWSADKGRTASTFDDPNVYGSYLTLAAVYILRNLLVGRAKRPLLSTAMLAVLIIGIFLSYSRGSWGALVVASSIMAITAFISAAPRTRRRIAIMGSAAAAVGAIAIGGLLAQPQIRTMFTERAALEQSYDAGPAGRFGNQIRSLPMLLERPAGFGPLRFRDYFHLEPHNSYVGAFANDGWIGGLTWLIITLSTCYVGFRLTFTRSPYRAAAQVFWPVLFAWLLQGLQIDIDHWRQLFLGFGAVWGMEAARVRWMEQEARDARGSQQLDKTIANEGDLCPAGSIR